MSFSLFLLVLRDAAGPLENLGDIKKSLILMRGINFQLTRIHGGFIAKLRIIENRSNIDPL